VCVCVCVCVCVSEEKLFAVWQGAPDQRSLSQSILQTCAQREGLHCNSDKRCKH